MTELHVGQFQEFFYALHNKQPFPWQEALAARVCVGEWPELIDLPTASGKTACIDIALFALAVRGNEAPRRIFFVVDRRIVVNEAYLRMCGIRDRLTKALAGDESGILHDVAERLQKLARGNQTEMDDEGGDPLFVSEMRGGAFRDESWIRNPLQPTVVASTVDQVGSRLLFRGYGVSENLWPIHAGLIGNDALILLDEAHSSRAFAQTLKRVERYRGKKWASDPISPPFHFVEMTATPSRPVDEAKLIKLTEDDRNVLVLKKRLQAAKPTNLIPEIKGKKDDTAKLVDALTKQAISLAKAADAKRVAVFANRVKTAKQAYKKLQELMEGSGAQVELAIGSMRAVDRDDFYKHRLNKLKADAPRKADDALTFVVSTQCLETGADLDFDVLVSECASIDALLQRFGRLDRLGEFGRARGAIVIGSWQINSKQHDAVYGEALSKTWEWLKGFAGESSEMNMGIESRAGEPPTVSEQLESLNENDRDSLHLIGEDAPILLPAHVDMLAQTSPVPEPSPLVELFLHGPKCGVPDVLVVWRSDLENSQDEDEDTEIIKLCPPSSAEAMPVSLSTFRKWFAGEKDFISGESDLEAGMEGGEGGELTQQRKTKIYVIAWDGEKSRRVWDANKIKPGQTLVLKESTGGWHELGYIPNDALIDVGDRAALVVRKSISLRLHSKLIEKWPKTPTLELLKEQAGKADAKLEEVEEYLHDYGADLKESGQPWPYAFLKDLDKMRRKDLVAYPGPKSVYVLRARLPQKNDRRVSEQVFLDDHLTAVDSVAATMASDLDEKLQDALGRAARFHDYGKKDVRYQAWLCGGNVMAARYLPKPVAKSGNDVLRKQKMVGLPKGFRHELLSLMFAEKAPEMNGEMRDLVLHLIASHHGRCRPFAPVVLDRGAECVSYGGISICADERVENTPHRLGGGVSDRFWRLTAKYGWWGLAYLEAILRLADWRASEGEAAEVSD